MIKDENLLLKEKFLEYYRELPVQKLACGIIGRSEDTVIRWKDRDVDFANQIEDAKSKWAMARTKRVKSEEWLLERVLKDHFSPRQELTGADGGAIKTELDKLETNYDQLSREIKEQTVETGTSVQDQEQKG